MKQANIADVKSHLSELLALVAQGEEIQVCKRNEPVARIVAVGRKPVANRTQLGCGVGTGEILADVTEPALPLDAWKMLTE